MKRFSGWFGLMMVLGLTGCNSGTISGSVEPTPDNRPPGFEDMMKDMGDKMKKSAHPKRGPAPSTAPR